MDSLASHIIYVLFWATFGFGHSFIAGDMLKNSFGPWYRVGYNVIATIHTAIVYGVGLWLFAKAAPLDLPSWANTPMWAMHLIGWALMLYALTGYDLGRFSGLAQVRAARAGRNEPEDEPLILTGLHRYVRHPLYAAAFLILWGAAQDQMHLATALWGSLYLIVGTRFEEQRLQWRYGAAYAAYRRRVPAFIPWKGRAWSDTAVCRDTS